MSTMRFYLTKGLFVVLVTTWIIYFYSLILPSSAILLEDSIQDVIGSVVHITNESGHWQGSGLIVAPDIIVTARHVVDDGNDFTITFNCGKTAKSYRAISSKKYDIGFLQTDEIVARKKPPKLGSILDCKLGQQVFAVGSPFGKINRNSVTLGIISRMDCNFQEYPYEVPPDYGWPGMTFQTDVNGEPGNSGCPIFSLDGIVRGILVGGYSNGIIYCLPVDLFIQDLKIVKLLFTQDKYDFEKRFVPKVVVMP